MKTTTYLGMILLILFNLSMNAIETSKLLPGHYEGKKEFGQTVCTNGEFIFVSSDSQDFSESSGYVHVFRLQDGTWIETDTIEQDLYVHEGYNSQNRDLGTSMASDGDWLAIGSPNHYIQRNDSTYGKNVVYLYKRNGDNWEYHSAVNPLYGHVDFGRSLTMEGKQLIVGAPEMFYWDPEDTDFSDMILNIGIAYYYKYNDSEDKWELKQEITAPENIESNYFGRNLSISGDWLLTAAYNPADEDNYIVYFYELINKQWTLRQSIDQSLSRERELGISFDEKLDISGNYAFVSSKYSGYKRSVQVYKFNGISWEEHQILYDDDEKFDYGENFSLHGDFAVVSQLDDDERGYKGAASLYKNMEDKWTKVAHIAPIDGSIDAFFGYSLQVGDSSLVIGAYNIDTLGISGLGATYTYYKYWDLPWVKADFAFNPMIVSVNTDVNFSDLSNAYNTNITQWKWDFYSNDTINSNEENPSFQFTTGGHIPVTLTVSDGLFSNSITKWITVIDHQDEECSDYIPFGGEEKDTLGIAAWHADGNGNEARKIGHHLPQPPASIDHAYYYLASRDYSDIDMNATAGLKGNGDIVNWPNLTQALTDNGKTVDDLEISFGMMSLGDDQRAVDWQLTNDQEWRRYTGGTFSITLNGESMIGGTMPALDLYIDYEVFEGRVDIINGESSYATAEDQSEISSAEAQAIAAAFINDCNGEDIKFMFASIQAALQMEFAGNGRFGGYFDVKQGYILKGCPCALNVDAGDDQRIAIGNSVQLNATIENNDGAVSYNWLPAEGLDNAAIANPVFTVDETTEFEVTVTDARGCSTSDVVKITAFEAPAFNNNFCYDLLLPQAENELNKAIYPVDVAVNGQHAFISDYYSVDFTMYSEIATFQIKNNAWIPTGHLTVSELLNNRSIPKHSNTQDGRMGHSMDSDNDWLVVGAKNWAIANNEYQGAVFIYKRQGNNWIYHSYLADPLGSQNDEFGSVVSIDGDYIAVSNPLYDSQSTYNVGTMLIFKYNDVTDTWEMAQRINGPDAASSGRFGSSLDLEDNYIIVSAPDLTVNSNSSVGKTYIYKNNAGTWELDANFEIVGAERNTHLGESVALSGNTALATYLDQVGDDKYKVRAYKLEAGVWSFDSDWIMPTEGSYEVKISDDYALLSNTNYCSNGEYYAYTGADTWGIAYVCQKIEDQWFLTDTILPNNYEHVDDFGTAIDLEGGKAMIGVYADGNQGDNKKGGAYMLSCFKEEPAIEADFTTSPMLGVALADINFNDNSIATLTDITSWSWDFNNDGVEDSNLPNPVHQFDTEGHHKVSLTVSDGDIESSISHHITVFPSTEWACQSYIPFAGDESNNQGVVAWNSDENAPERSETGHNLPQPPASIQTAYYYMASRDYIEPASGAISGNGDPVNWPNLSQALTDQGYAVENLSISFGLSNLGKDSKGIEWDLVDNYEWRKYNGGTFIIKLNGEDMIAGPMPELQLDINYKAFEGGVDKISGETGFALPQNNSAASSAGVQAVAAAFMQDCGNDGIKFIFASIESALQMDFDKDGRFGGYFNVDQGYIYKACNCNMEILAPDKWVKSNRDIDLEVEISKGIAPFTYEWSPHLYLENSYSATPTANVPFGMTYQVIVSDAMGCTAIDFIDVHVDAFGAIEGYIRDNETGDIITEADVYLYGMDTLQTLSDKEGYYRFRDLIPDSNYLVVAQEGIYGPDSASHLIVQSDETTLVDINLKESAVTSALEASLTHHISVHYNGNQIEAHSKECYITQVSVYDMLGRLVQNDKLENQTAWHSTTLSNGNFYCVKVQSTGGVSSYKVVTK